MIKTEFKRIAANENGEFFYKDEDIAVGDGTRSPNVEFVIKFDYKEIPITIYNTTGTQYLGKIYCDLPLQTQSADFKLHTRSHLGNLFYRSKSRYIIKCKSNNLNHFLRTNTAIKKLSTISNETNFDPYIAGKNSNRIYKLTCSYYLGFDDWTQVLEPLIEFYKALIDELFQHNTHIANNAYRSLD